MLARRIRAHGTVTRRRHHAGIDEKSSNTNLNAGIKQYQRAIRPWPVSSQTCSEQKTKLNTTCTVHTNVRPQKSCK